MQKRYNTQCFFSSVKNLPNQITLNDNSSIVLENYGTYCEPMNCSVSNSNIYGVEILTQSEDEAYSIVDILCACHTVVEGFNNENPEDIILRLYKNQSDPLLQVGTRGVFYGDDLLMHACNMTQKAYVNQVYKNAICKYHVAHEIYSLHPMDLHPLDDPFKNTYILSEQIKIATVIVECYSVLEELNTQINANKDNPSVIDGKWNPDVKAELYTRLKSKNIDPDESIPWLTRNGVIRPFKESVVEKNSLCEWSDGTEIKDFNINICDAILEVSYMRSQLSSHKFGDKVLKLTVYDAENAFALSRYILLMFFDIHLVI